jgi:hypothetical protein
VPSLTVVGPVWRDSRGLGDRGVIAMGRGWGRIITAVVPLVLLPGLAAGCGGQAPPAASGDEAPADDGTAAVPDEDDNGGAIVDEDDNGGTVADGDATDTDTDLALEDGRYAVYLVDVDVADSEVTFDLIQFLTGDEATEAYREDTDDPEGIPENDYYIRNDLPRVRVLPVDPSATVTVVRLGEASGAGSVPWSFETLPDHLADEPGPPDGRLAWNPYWLTLEHGEVVAIDEQYLP